MFKASVTIFCHFRQIKEAKIFSTSLLFFSVVLKACDYIRRLLPGTHAFLSINIAYCMCSTSILADIEVSFGCHSFISVKKMQKENGIFFRIIQRQFRLISTFFFALEEGSFDIGVFLLLCFLGFTATFYGNFSYQNISQSFFFLLLFFIVL